MRIKVRSKLGDYLYERGIKKNWFAKQIGSDNTQVTRWCQNDNNGMAVSTPSVGYLLRMTRVLGCEVTDIYEEVR